MNPPQDSKAPSLSTYRSNPSLSTLFASTSSLPASGRSSGTATPTAALAGSVFSPGVPNGGLAPLAGTQGRPDEPRNLILRSFVPHVGVVASADTEEILREKGFHGGFLELIRPFGELVHGKVTIRNSVGASTSWDDFGIRFMGLKDALDTPSSKLSGSTARSSIVIPRVGGDVAQVEEAVDRHLSFAELQGPSGGSTDYLNHKENDTAPKLPGATSPFYSLYMRRLLSGFPMSTHETFSHPVACVIAISSRNPSPIEELRRLYTSTNTGDDRLPMWVNNEFLRYYVLVHDEDHDDISKSTTLYEQMKRHFGLHCHLLRLRSAQCVPSDDDSVRLPISEWLPAAEELSEISRREAADNLEDPTSTIFESDVVSVRTFVRELVAQSIIPSMERNCAQWNEQVATRRRGISGRLMSLSKRWTPFGTSSRNSSSPTSSGSSNYDSLQGFYRPDAPEAIMRKLADYAFMLRDFKLAQSTYDLLRGDFDNDKAWKYYAGANEMAAVSTLLSTQAMTSKLRVETVDRMLEAATHSYIHRSMTPYYALRSLVMGLELLKLRGSSAADDAARWGSRILEAGLVGPIGIALVKERIGVCYSSKQGIGSMSWGSRRRKSAFWAVLAAESFANLGKSNQAEKCLEEAWVLYGLKGDSKDTRAKLEFDGMRGLLDGVREKIVGARLIAQGYRGEDGSDDDGTVGEKSLVVEEESETLDEGRPHRHSLIGAQMPLDPLGVMTMPLSPLKAEDEDEDAGDEEGFR
ncbi:Transport protein particle subunit trs85-2 [Venturia nashicola]|uniref:Transport protein particle subunit trs85-2 n=1 Tax=Venturia nashicola TaxID=86259 RepID=A0A4Z1P8V5_9PEZI|nr:Transport protein particle subunit trs85-2 [Venturia nashicola]TLD37790.1 Transport protein particle subunit trs85-2 [Venturia nashicola]